MSIEAIFEACDPTPDVPDLSAPEPEFDQLARESQREGGCDTYDERVVFGVAMTGRAIASRPEWWKR